MENTKTKFHPILFSTPMVQALIEGRKTMTRRTKGLEKFNLSPDRFRFDGLDEEGVSYYMEHLNENGKETENYFEIIPPYKVGDVLWVRENYYTASNWDHWKPSMLKSVNVKVFFVADSPNYDIPRPLSRGKIRPCIFLPKEYSRIFLKVKAVRVERLQDISDEDAKGEGAKDSFNYDEIKMLEGLGNWNIPKPFFNHQFGFLSIWCKINGCKNWLENPFVFVYEFEIIEKPLDFLV
jgi:hypothetical protein